MKGTFKHVGIKSKSEKTRAKKASLMGDGSRLDFPHGHPLEHLVRDFCQDLLGQHLLVPDLPRANEFPQFDELDDVSGRGHAAAGTEHALVAVQSLHS